jgi:hypothetical protein
MGFVKAIVIGMGVLIFAGFTVVAVTLIMRMQEMDEPAEAYKTAVSLPRGAAVIDAAIGDGEVLLRVEEPGGSAWLLVIDAGTGQEQGRIQLLPEAP